MRTLPAFVNEQKSRFAGETANVGIHVMPSC